MQSEAETCKVWRELSHWVKGEKTLITCWLIEIHAAPILLARGTESGTEYVAKRYKTTHNVESAAVAGQIRDRRK